MPLSTADLNDVRKIIMDTDNSDYALTDDEINHLWDNKSKGNITVLYILCLQRVRGVYAQKIDLTESFGDNRQLSSLFRNATQLLTYYTQELERSGYTLINGEITPINYTGTKKGMGFIDKNLDTDSIEDEEGYILW